MAAANSKPSAAQVASQIGKLETEMKTAFKGGQWELVRKKVDEIRKVDPQNRVAERILQKAQEEEKAALKKANAAKIKALEVKMDQSFKVGNLNAMTQALEELKKLDPANGKALKAEATIAKAKEVLESEIRKEEARKLSSEVEFFANRAEWDHAVTKANELLSLEWGNSVALKILKKAAMAKKVSVDSLITAKAPKVEKKPGFFARLFGKKSMPPAEVIKTPAKEMPKAPVAPAVAKPEVSVLKPLAPVVPAKMAVPVANPAPAKPMVEPKPVAPVPQPSAPKPSVFGNIFAKKEEPKPAVAPAVAKPEVSVLKPLAPVAPVKSASPILAPVVAPVMAKPAEIQLKVEQKTVAKSDGKAQEKGNIFTSLFGKEEVAEKPTASVLETIVAKTAPSKPEPKKEKMPEERTGEGFLAFSKVFLQFSIAFIAISAAFFYVENIDANNTVLGFSLINKENNAIKLRNAAETVRGEDAKVKELNKEISKYQGGYQDENRDTIKKIIASRMDWPDILKKLNEVTESVYEKNAISQYVQYNNYTYNTETGQLTVAGTLSDPLGKNLTKLAELEQAFRNYPKDPQNPSDDRKPYFFGLQEFRSFAKTFNASTGRYQSSFTLTLYTKEQKKAK